MLRNDLRFLRNSYRHGNYLSERKGHILAQKQQTYQHHYGFLTVIRW